MERQHIPAEKLQIDIIKAWAERWFLLTAGRLENQAFNCMTVAWGSIGVMWKKPFVQVVVRPSRHTFAFIEENDSFTLCAFPEAHKQDLLKCGTQSGRDIDKIQATGLTPVASSCVDAPGYEEAELIIECRKMYADNFSPDRFLDEAIEPNYGGKDYHRFYFGEILAVYGTSDYMA